MLENFDLQTQPCMACSDVFPTGLVLLALVDIFELHDRTVKLILLVLRRHRVKLHMLLLCTDDSRYSVHHSVMLQIL